MDISPVFGHPTRIAADNKTNLDGRILRAMWKPVWVSFSYLCVRIRAFRCL